jgi:hypothetical protein
LAISLKIFLAGLRLGLKNPQVGEKWVSDDGFLFLILSHLNAFVLSVGVSIGIGVGSISNVYAANQVVNTTKSPTTHYICWFFQILSG